MIGYYPTGGDWKPLPQSLGCVALDQKFESLMMPLIMSYNGVTYKNSKYCQKRLKTTAHS